MMKEVVVVEKRESEIHRTSHASIHSFIHLVLAMAMGVFCGWAARKYGLVIVSCTVLL